MSRTGRPTDRHPLGKCSEARIDIPVPAALKLYVNSIATLRGKTLAQYAREALEERAVLDAYRMGVNLPPNLGDADGINVPKSNRIATRGSRFGDKEGGL